MADWGEILAGALAGGIGGWADAQVDVAKKEREAERQEGLKKLEIEWEETKIGLQTQASKDLKKMEIDATKAVQDAANKRQEARDEKADKRNEAQDALDEKKYLLDEKKTNALIGRTTSGTSSSPTQKVADLMEMGYSQDAAVTLAFGDAKSKAAVLQEGTSKEGTTSGAKAKVFAAAGVKLPTQTTSTDQSGDVVVGTGNSDKVSTIGAGTWPKPLNNGSGQISENSVELSDKSSTKINGDYGLGTEDELDVNVPDFTESDWAKIGQHVVKSAMATSNAMPTDRASALNADVTGGRIDGGESLLTGLLQAATWLDKNKNTKAKDLLKK